MYISALKKIQINIEGTWITNFIIFFKSAPPLSCESIYQKFIHFFLILSRLCAHINQLVLLSFSLSLPFNCQLSGYIYCQAIIYLSIHPSVSRFNYLHVFTIFLCVRPTWYVYQVCIKHYFWHYSSEHELFDDRLLPSLPHKPPFPHLLGPVTWPHLCRMGTHRPCPLVLFFYYIILYIYYILY